MHEHDREYSQPEARVAAWLTAHTGMGGGSDPVGWVLASYEVQMAEMAQLRAQLALAKAVINQSRTTCGRQNCNCPGAHKVRKLVETFDKACVE